MEITPISAVAANLQGRISSVMPVSDPDRVPLPPINEALTSSSKVPLPGEHYRLIAINLGIVAEGRLSNTAADLLRASVPHTTTLLGNIAESAYTEVERIVSIAGRVRQLACPRMAGPVCKAVAVGVQP